MSFLDKSPAEEWDALSKKRRAEARRISETLKAEERATKYSAKSTDAVNPSHYKGNGIECIDYMKERLGRYAFLGYINGNVIKYMHRWEFKNGIEDLRKARWYLDRLIEEEERSPK